MNMRSHMGIRLFRRAFSRKSGNKLKRKAVVLPGQGVGLLQGIELCREHAWANFNETLECSVTLNLDPRKANQNIRTILDTPFPLNKETNILVISGQDEVKDVANTSNVSFLSKDQLDEAVEAKNKFKYSHIFCTIDSYDALKRKLGRTLGSKKLMPNDATRTLVYSIEELEKRLVRVKEGSITLRNDRLGSIRFGFGRLTLSDSQLLENVSAVLLKILQTKPEGTKGKYFISAAMSSTMGPGVKLNIKHADPNSMFFRQPVVESELEIEKARCVKKVAKSLVKRKKGTTPHPCKREDGTYMTMKEYAAFKETNQIQTT